MFKRLMIIGIFSLFAPNLVTAQDQKRTAVPVIEQAPNPFDEGDDRNGMWVPENVGDLRLISQEWWQQFRRTNQRLYKYVGEAAEFRAYLEVCKRHDLNVDMDDINALSSRHLQQILLALFKEAEYAVLESQTKEQQAELMADVASDAYSFEYGYRIAHQTAIINVTGGTTNNYCEQVAEVNFKKYIALRATAKRQVGQTQR